MRNSKWLGGLFLAAVVTIGLFFTQTATPAPADDRDELASKLLERVTLKDPQNNVALKDVLESLAEKHGITVLVDQKSFSSGAPAAVALKTADETVLNQQISVPAMKNVRLGTVLKYIADQVDGIYLIYPDHVKIVSVARAITLTNPTFKGYARDEPDEGQLEGNESLMRSVPLVTVNFSERPLQEVLADIEQRTNRSIILANQASDKAKTPITARFSNVPVERAVDTLAEMAGLKMARKGNVLLVTTVERAKVLETPAPTQLANPGFGQPAPFVDPTIEDLKKKVAEMEKTIAELKRK